MPPPPVRSHILQSPNVFLNLSPQVVLDLHVRQFGGQVEYLSVLQGANFRPWKDVEAGHDTLRDFGADAIEGFEGALDYC